MQLGGMALRDGVLLQSDGYWAAAVREEDGGVKVVSGRQGAAAGARDAPARPGPPRRGPAGRGAGGPAGGAPQDRRAGAAAGGPAAAGGDGGERGRDGRAARVAGGARRCCASWPWPASSLAPVLLALRDSRLSRYHGAEHKSVAAYESGGDPADGGQGARPLRLQPHRADGGHQPRDQPGAAGGRQGAAAAGDVRRRARQHRHGDGAVLLDVAPPGPPAGADAAAAGHRDAAPVHDQRAHARSSWTWPTWRCRSCCGWRARRRPPEPRTAGRRPAAVPARPARQRRRGRQSAGSRSASRLRRRSSASAYHSFCWSVCGTSWAPGSACRCR